MGISPDPIYSSLSQFLYPTHGVSPSMLNSKASEETKAATEPDPFMARIWKSLHYKF